MPFDPNVLVGFETGDDAAIYRVTDEIALVLTLDFFPPIVDDPYDYGAIAVANAVSDVYAVGGRPVAGLNIAGFPEILTHETIAKILEGGAAKAAEAGFPIIGGHTVRDNEPKYGMAVTGFVHPGKQVTNAAARVGDKLVLTKPLGTGIIATAGKEQVAAPEVLATAVKSMSTLNRDAADAMIAVDAHSATDVTGFGLVGHLMGMTRASGVNARLWRSTLPVLDSTIDLIDAGMVPGGTHRNLASLGDGVAWDEALTAADKFLMADPQTSGGMLISVSEKSLDELLLRLRDAGTLAAAVVGEIVPGPGVVEARQ
jgi:selenide,water dikinase